MAADMVWNGGMQYEVDLVKDETDKRASRNNINTTGHFLSEALLHSFCYQFTSFYRVPERALFALPRRIYTNTAFHSTLALNHAIIS